MIRINQNRLTWPGGRYRVAFWVGMGWLLAACQPQAIEEAPISLATYEVPEGYQLEVVAAEPLIQAPVAIDFDHQGRLWVVELQGYMTNLDALHETDPTGRIVILSDRDEDGRMDHSQVFLDSLVLPRAIRLIEGGLLYAEPPNLWWVEVSDTDQPGRRVLVDSAYVEAGNVEHQPNGLLPNLDNWLYNANSNQRYRYQQGQWQRDYTANRGQWGLTHDDQGRLYSNHNSTLLLGDQAWPQAVLQHRYLMPQHSLSQVLPDHQRLYPSHATWINRGYQPGTLDSLGRVTTPTATCGPLIFRGDGLQPTDYGQAFVCAPEANLVKRLPLHDSDGLVQADNAEAGPEFLRSRDPYFRPVNLSHGPDGALYVVDMHRGVIQHQAYMTGYLRQRLAEGQLDTAIHQGRILALRRAGSTRGEGFDWQAASVPDLVAALSHPNGWRRDHAQQELIHRQARAAIPALRQLLRQPAMQPSLHAFWTLEGLGALNDSSLQAALDHPASPVSIAGLYYLVISEFPRFPAEPPLRWEQLLASADPALDRYLALALPRLVNSAQTLRRHWSELARRQPMDLLLPEFAVSGWGDSLAMPAGIPPVAWREVFAQVAQAQQEDAPNPDLVGMPPSTDDRTVGLRLYRQHCSGCHGVAGRGQAAVAPSLVGSAYVSGPVEPLGLILLYGLRGPIHSASGTPVEFAGQMPGFGQNAQLSSEDLAAIMAYVRNAFSRASARVDPATIDALRQWPWPEEQAFTEETLRGLIRQQAAAP
jgi:mono/diheme cytochrome c family protein